MKREPIREICLLLMISIIIFMAFLGSSRLWDRDEPRNAGCAREMLARGDWIVPTFNGELRAHKPALLYWVIMGAYWLLGISEFSARVGSAIFGTGTVLLTYAIGCRLLPRPGAFWSAVCLATMLLFAISSRSATPDAPLIFFGTLGIACFVAAYFPRANGGISLPQSAMAREGRVTNGGAPSQTPAPREKLLPLLGMYAAWGLATLAKGPVGFVLPAAVIFQFLGLEQIIRRSLAVEPSSQTRGFVGGQLLRMRQVLSFRLWWETARRMKLALGLVIVLAVAGPWYFAVGVSTDGAFVQEFFLRHHLQRSLEPLEGHRGSILFYPAALLVGTFPWSVFAVPCVLMWRRDCVTEWGMRAVALLLSVWVLVYLGVFSIVQTKLPSYLLPCYPAVALFVGHFLARLPKTAAPDIRTWTKAAVVVLGLIGGVAMVSLPLVAQRLLGGESWMASLGFILLAGAVACWWLFVHKGGQALTNGMLATAFIFTLMAVAIVPARVSRHRWLEAVIERLGHMSTEVAAIEFCEPSWVFYFGRSIPKLTRRDEREIGRALSEGVLLVPEATYAEIKSFLPPHECLVAGPRFLRPEKILLLVGPERRNLLSQAAHLCDRPTSLLTFR